MMKFKKIIDSMKIAGVKKVAYTDDEKDFLIGCIREGLFPSQITSSKEVMSKIFPNRTSVSVARKYERLKRDEKRRSN